MATKKKEDTKKKGGKEKDAEKEAKRKARMEALKNNDRTVNRLMLSKSMTNPRFRTTATQ